MKETYVEQKYREEREWHYKNVYSPKAIFLNIITLGFYGYAKLFENARRIGIY